MSNGIPLEVIGSHNERYPAQLHSFPNDNEVMLRFDENPEINRKLPVKQVHLVVESSTKSTDLIIGSDVLVYQQVDDLNSAGINDTTRLTHAWWPGKIVKLKGCFAAINLLYRENESSSDIVEIANVRPMPQSCEISRHDIHSHEMVVPDDLCEFCENYDLRADLVRWCGPSIVLNFDKSTKRLHIFSTQQEVVRKASLLDASFMRVLRQKKLIHFQKAELTKRLNDSIRNNFIEEFTVSEELMGLAIGSQGNNIKKAREIEGIISIDLDDRSHTFTITAENQEAAKDARAQLEYMRKIYYVPEEVVSKVIGRNGNQIQDIIDQSGVMRVRVAKQTNTDQWTVDEANRHLLVDHVPFIFVGNSNSIRDACLLLEFSIDHHREMDRLQKERDEIHREIRNNKQNNSGSSSHLNNRRYISLSEDESAQISNTMNNRQPGNNPRGSGSGSGNNYRNNNRNNYHPPRGGSSSAPHNNNRTKNQHQEPSTDDNMSGGTRINNNNASQRPSQNNSQRPGSYKRGNNNSSGGYNNNNYRQGSLPPHLGNTGSQANHYNGGNRRYYGYSNDEDGFYPSNYGSSGLIDDEECEPGYAQMNGGGHYQQHNSNQKQLNQNNNRNKQQSYNRNNKYRGGNNGGRQNNRGSRGGSSSSGVGGTGGGGGGRNSGDSGAGANNVADNGSSQQNKSNVGNNENIQNQSSSSTPAPCGGTVETSDTTNTSSMPCNNNNENPVETNHNSA